MAGYVSPDDILKGVTSSSDTTNEKGYVSADDIINSAPTPAQTDQPIPSFQFETNLIHPDQSQFMQQVNHYNSQPDNQDARTDYPGGLFNPLNDLGHLSNTIRPFTHSAGQAMGVPDNMMLSGKSTGNNIVDKVESFLGSGAGFLTNPSSLSNGIGQNFFGNSLVQNLGSKVGSLVESKLPQNFLGRAVTNAAEQATVGGLGSAVYAPFQTLMSGQDVQDIPKNILEQGLMGVALGGAGGALGSLAKSGYKSAEDILRGTKEPVLPDYSNIKLSTGDGTTNPVKLADQAPMAANETPSGYKSADQILNSDAVNPEPIKLTPAEVARNERIDKFSQVEDNPQIPNTADQIQSKTGKESVPLLTRANEAYIKGVDNLHRINQFDQQIKDVTGGSNASDSTYKLALNSRGSDMISRQILEKNLVDSQGNVIGDSLKSVAKNIPKGQQSAFEDYLIAKHSITRMGRGEKVYSDNKNMTIQKAQAIVDNYEKSNPKFKEVAQKYYDYNNKLGQAWLVDTGILSQKQWDGYREANPHYVPNNRIFTDLEKQAQFGSKRGFANQTNPVKRAEGSQRQIVSPIESTIENTAKYVKTAKQNEVSQTLYRNILKNPEAFKAWGEVVHDQPNADVNQMLHDEGIDGVLNEVTKSFEQKPDLTKGNIVSALVDGQRVHMRIHDPQLLEALTNLSPHAQNFVMDTVGKVTKFMKVVTTGLNPVFGLTRNIFRDIPHAFIASKTTNNPLIFSKDLVQSIVSVFGDGKLYNDFKNFGGGHSSSVAADRNLLAQTKEKLLPSNGLKQSAKRVLSKPFHILENMNNAVESAPRLAEFKRTQNGTYDSKIQALYNANDVTTNFNKFGNYTKQADQLFPYLNAAVQGLDQLGRMFKENKTATLTKATATLTMPAIALYFMNHNDPNYNQVSNFTKDNYFLIPKGDGTFFKVAKPRELGMVFSTGVERVLRAFADHDPKAFQDFGNNFLQNFLPPGASGAVSGFGQKGLTGVPTGMLGDTIAGPIQSLASNKDFANRDIVPRDLAQLSPRLQYDAKTSEPAKFIGNLLNSSPKQLDYLVKSYGGVLGQLGVPLTTKGGSLGDTLKQQITADPTFSNDISRNFYDQKSKADMAKADAKSQGDAPPDNMSAYYDRLSTKFSKIRQQQKRIQNDDSLSKSEKQRKIKELQQMLNELQAGATK